MKIDTPLQEENRLVIVGAGPVGLALALLLAKYKIPSLVLEARRDLTSPDESRAIMWMPRGLEFLEWLGVSESLISHGVMRTVHEFWTDKEKVFTIPFDQAESPYHYALHLPQYDTERLLETAARATGLVEIRRRHVATRGESTATHAIIHVGSAEGVYSIECPWAIACDGARSTIREAFSIGQERRDYGTDAGIADFEMTCSLPEETSRIYLDPKRPYGFFYFGENRWRFVYRLNKGEDRETMTDETVVKNLLQSKLPDVKVKRLLWATATRLTQGNCLSYRSGRWILAGDAAHPMGPLVGAGMMTGMLGVWRLGWRLALIMQNHPQTDHLLDDYEREQRHAANDMQDISAVVFHNMALNSSLLGTLRAQVMKVATRINYVSQYVTAKETLVRQKLPVSSACDSYHSLAWKSLKKFGRWRSGQRLPYLNNSYEDNLLSRIGPTHVFVSIGKVDGEKERGFVERLREFADIPIVPEIIAPYEGSGYRRTGEGKVTLALVRPDQHVAGIYQLLS